MLVAARGVFIKHQLGTRPTVAGVLSDLSPIFAIAGPAMLTNIATPIGNGFITRAIAGFGDGYVAGWAVLGRLTPVAFGMIFALSGAIGPIVGQNFGARRFDRLRDCLTKSLLFCGVYVLGMSLILFIAQDFIIHVFDMKGDAADLIGFFLTYMVVFFVFSGALFVANASFNNLGKAKYSTVFNVGKATLGTLPFIWLGAQYGGIYGVLIGQVIGSVIFGVAGVYCAYRLVAAIEGDKPGLRPAEVSAGTDDDEVMPASSSPLSSSFAQMATHTEEKDTFGAQEATAFLVTPEKDLSQQIVETPTGKSVDEKRS